VNISNDNNLEPDRLSSITSRPGNRTGIIGDQRSSLHYNHFALHGHVGVVLLQIAFMPRNIVL